MFDYIFSHLFADACSTMVETPDTSDLTIDYADVESVVFAAGVLEQHGEWDRARELYRHLLAT